MMESLFSASLVLGDLANLVDWGHFDALGHVLAQLPGDMGAGDVRPGDYSGGNDEGVSWKQIQLLLIAVAVIVLPFVVGNWFARTARMPAYGTRFGFILLALTASGVILFNKLPGLGVDLRGGTILVYEIDRGQSAISTDEQGQQIASEDLIEPLSRRINPSGTQEIVIRPYGEDQIEIIIPEIDDTEVKRIKGIIEQAGILRFAIVANRADHQRVIDLAEEQAASEVQGIRTRNVVIDPDMVGIDKSGLDRSKVGFWARVDREKEETPGSIRPLRINVGDSIVRNPATGEVLELPAEVRGDDAEAKIVRWMGQQNINEIEVLMISDPQLNITGEDLAFAASAYDESGNPSVAFTLKDAGSGKFFALTTNNAPVGNRQRQLGIVLDNDLLSAPNIRQPISGEGRITGNFTTEEVQSLVAVLKAGQLPAALTKQPIAENQIDATLGSDTREKGVFATGLSMTMVLVFMLFYYRFSGIIACIALLMNLAMILATMVLINQPLTLPGLAGLVLTVGMSVDANVLIFERLREELNKGAASRMAIRNGFARATTTIVDANLTTLITAIVLYAIGTDQIRGFAVTLILGILYSMFTAIYVSRTFFDYAERNGFLSLSMSDMVNSLRSSFAGGGQLDFMGKGKLALAMSGLLMIVGMVALFARGSGILDIDFAGGSSVQFRLDRSTPADEVRRIVGKSLNTDPKNPVQVTVTSVLIQNLPKETVYKVDSSVEKVEELKSAISAGFASEAGVGLVTYEVKVSPEGEARVQPSASNGVMLAVARAQDDAETSDAAENSEPVDNAVTKPADSSAPAVTAPPKSVSTRRTIEVGIEGEAGGATINSPALIEGLVNAANEVSVPLNDRGIELIPFGEGSADWTVGSAVPFSKWTVSLPLPAEQADQVIGKFKQTLGSDPVWISSSSVGGQVAGDMIGRAFGALFASLLCIVGYIWFRFQRVFYGLAAVAALVHDVVITLGAIAISYWIADALGFLLIDPFKISLTVVAALLTIIGYSLNDTIVVFDRIRETKGKALRLTGDMINSSINMTLSRTLLTSLTTLIVVVLLYAFGGDGIHAFAFCLVVGVVVGTYSSVFIASPILLWLLEREQRNKVAATR